MKNALKGVIHGKIIELEQEPKIPDGQAVLVTVEPTSDSSKKLLLGEGIRRSAGAWKDDPEGLDEFLELNRHQRKQGRRELEA